MKKILYLTDKTGITSGYRYLFEEIIAAGKLTMQDVIITSIYPLVTKPIHRVGNQLAWVAYPDSSPDVQAALDLKISAINPKVIVTSCPAILGVITNLHKYANTVDKCRGGVYDYKGIPVIVTFPIGAANQNTTKKKDQLHSDGDEAYGAMEYTIKSGEWILQKDWQKVGRFFHDRQKKVPPFSYSVIRTVEDARIAEEFLNDCILIADDCETVGAGVGGGAKYTQSCKDYTGLTKDGKIHSFVFPFYDKFVKADGTRKGGNFWESAEDHQTVWEIAVRIAANPVLKTLQNGTYDNSYYIRDCMPSNNYLLDTIHMWHCMFPELQKSLDFISSILLDVYQYWKSDLKGIDEKRDESHRDTTMEGYYRYNALDGYYTILDTISMLPSVMGNESIRFNYQQEFMQAMAGLTMSMRGIKTDMNKLADHRLSLLEREEAGLETIGIMVDDPDFNPNSPPQMASLFYDVLNCTPMDAKGKKIGPTSKAKRSAGAIPLKMLASTHPYIRAFVDSLHEAKRPGKQISNICNMATNLQTDRYRYHLSGCGTETWRFSSKKSNFWDGTNAQNITKSMRDWLIANPWYVLWDIDYSQSDGFYVAYESQDKNMIKTFTSGKDTHSVHAEHFFKTPYEEVFNGAARGDPAYVHPVTGIRQLTKRIVHGSNFQMGAFTLFTSMGRDAVIASAKHLGFTDAHTWTDEELIRHCGTMLGSYRNLYPRLDKREWYGDLARQLKQKHSITNAYGMTRRFLGNPADAGVQRAATAFMGQSGTSGNMNRVLNEIMFGYIPKTFRDGMNPCRKEMPMRLDGVDNMYMLLQVHDSFIGMSDTRVKGWQDNLNNLLTVMERPCIINGREMYVPANAEIGLRWGKGMIPWNRTSNMTYDDIRTQCV